MQLTVNGRQRQVSQGTTLRQLVESLNLKPEKVAIELNRRLVRDYDRELKDGDQIEIVTFVGGG